MIGDPKLVALQDGFGVVDTLLAASQHTIENEACFNRPVVPGSCEVNVKARLSPEDVARACADAMWKEDHASSGLGMKILDVKPGEATLTMTVQPHMVNGQRIAHGGFIFTLADSAFAFACNSRNERVVAAQCQIAFIRPAKLGDRLLAVAREISRSGRSGIYDVRVTAGEAVIAEFRGHSRTIAGSWLPENDTKQSGSGETR